MIEFYIDIRVVFLKTVFARTTYSEDLDVLRDTPLNSAAK